MAREQPLASAANHVHDRDAVTAADAAGVAPRQLQRQVIPRIVL